MFSCGYAALSFSPTVILALYQLGLIAFSGLFGCFVIVLWILQFGLDQDLLLFPVRMLREYLNRTASFVNRSCRLLFALFAIK